MTGMKSILPTLALLVVTGCSTVDVGTSTFDFPEDSSVRIDRISFEHATWEENDDPEFMADVLKREPGWRVALETGFKEQARDLGIDEGSGARVGLHVRITNLDPGSRTARYWIGLGVGAGTLTATVDAGTHGQFVAHGTLAGGVFGGDMDTVFRDLGYEIADEAAEHRGTPE